MKWTKPRGAAMAAAAIASIAGVSPVTATTSVNLISALTASCHTNVAASTSSTAEVPISDAYALQMAQAALGPEVAAKLTNRVTGGFPAIPHVSWAAKVSNTSTGESANWAGYVSTEANPCVTGATAEFNASPDFPTTGSDYNGAWAGVGGFCSNCKLIQTGLDMYDDYTWYELFPAAPVYLFPVNPGDNIAATVEWDANTNLWYVVSADTTTNKFWSSEFSFEPDQSSADVIVEAPSGHASGTFSPIHFIGAAWRNETSPSHPSTSGYLPLDDSSASHVFKLNLVDPDGGYACPSDLSPLDGVSQFTVRSSSTDCALNLTT